MASARKIIVVLLLGLVFYLSFFNHLDRLPLSIWDEARAAVSAAEMLHNPNPLVPTYDGAPDMFSLKPPLLIWLQAFFIKIFGYTQLAVRLPSALAGLGCCLLLIGFSKRLWGTFTPGILGALVLASTYGFVRDHAARTGDYDALLAFFMTAYLLNGFLYLKERKTGRLYLTAALVFLAILSKGAAGLLGLPALLLYVLLHRNTWVIWQKVHTYIAAGAALMLVIAYYLARDAANPGYLDTVIKGELHDVATTGVYGRQEPWFFYLKEIALLEFAHFAGIYLVGLFIYVKWLKGRAEQGFMLFNGLFVFSYLLLITLLTTKVEWYNVPLYPMAAFGVGIILFYIVEVLVRRSNFSPASYGYLLASAMVVLAVVAAPFYQVAHTNISRSVSGWDLEHYSGYMNSVIKKYPSSDSLAVSEYQYNPQMLFTHTKWQEDGVNIKRIQLKDTLTLLPGHIVMSCDHVATDDIVRRYAVDTLDNSGVCLTLKVVER